MFITYQSEDKYHSARKFISPWENNHCVLLSIAFLFSVAFVNVHVGREEPFL